MSITKEKKPTLVKRETTQITLMPIDNQRLANLCGEFNKHLHLIEQGLEVQIDNRGHQFQISGEGTAAEVAGQVLIDLYEETASDKLVTPEKINLFLQEAKQSLRDSAEIQRDSSTRANLRTSIRTSRTIIKTHNATQAQYLDNLSKHTVNFAMGPAGTGKTYLAVAYAVQSLEKGMVSRIILVRPAVEAGEQLGFLPGDLEEKINPYLRPLYDALYEMLGAEQVAKLLNKNIIEIAPLAYMRGRTLNDAFIILDEAQNSTPKQMKMFLTRIGFGSTAVITGDSTQIDLPTNSGSGLVHAMEVLKDVPNISRTVFTPNEVVRNPLVQQIVEAYDRHDEQNHPSNHNDQNKRP